MAYKSVTASYKYPKLPDPRGVREATSDEAKPGDVIAEGTYRGRNRTPSKFGKYSILVAEEAGQTVSLNPSGQLERLLEVGQVRVGDQIRITYVGMERIQKGDFKGQKAHQFKLEVDEERRTDAASLPELPSEEDSSFSELPEDPLYEQDDIPASQPRKIAHAASDTTVDTSKKSSNQELLDRWRSKIK
jgi:hypothetical protein